MNLNLFNTLFDNIKENSFVNNTENSNENDISKNLFADNLKINDKKIISKYKDEMLLERANILQNYALKTKDKGEMYYIYNINDNVKNEYNLCICEPSKSNVVITKKIEDLPEGTGLGSVLRKKGNEFILEEQDTKVIENQINNMIKEKIKEQDEYLNSKRIEGHIYEADEKYCGRIWLYDLNNKVGGRIEGSIEGIEEIEFPENLYETAKKGDKFIYQNGKYHKYYN